MVPKLLCTSRILKLVQIIFYTLLSKTLETFNPQKPYWDIIYKNKYKKLKITIKNIVYFDRAV
jgi:hypothetical protein